MIEVEAVRAIAILSGIAGVLTGIVVSAGGRLLAAPLRRSRRQRSLAQPEGREPQREEEACSGSAYPVGTRGQLHQAPLQAQPTHEPVREGEPEMSEDRSEVIRPRRVVIQPQRLVIRRATDQGRDQAKKPGAATELMGQSPEQKVNGSDKPIVIQRQARSYWESEGWTRGRGRINGRYKTPYGSFAGHVRQPDSQEPEFFIRNPPDELWDHPHGVCFHPASQTQYEVHIEPEPQHPDVGILAVERVLTEVLSRRRRRSNA